MRVWGNNRQHSWRIHFCSETIAAIVRSWPSTMDSSVARELGFEADPDLDSIITQFMAASAALRKN